MICFSFQFWQFYFMYFGRIYIYFYYYSIFLIDGHIYHYKMSFFVSSNSFCLEGWYFPQYQYSHSRYLLIIVGISFFFFKMEFRSCYPGWSAMARSQLTATSTSWVQANSPASASRVVEITRACHHARQVFLYFQWRRDFTVLARMVLIFLASHSGVNRCAWLDAKYL